MPSVIIGIANHKARKHKEKIHGKISVVNDLIKRAGGMGFEYVKPTTITAATPRSPSSIR